MNTNCSNKRILDGWTSSAISCHLTGRRASNIMRRKKDPCLCWKIRDTIGDRHEFTYAESEVSGAIPARRDFGGCLCHGRARRNPGLLHRIRDHPSYSNELDDPTEQSVEPGSSGASHPGGRFLIATDHRLGLPVAGIQIQPSGGPVCVHAPFCPPPHFVPLIHLL